MRSLSILILLLLCLYSSTRAQTSLLDKKVSLHYNNVALERVIGEMKKNYGLNFSYVNNFIPLTQKVTVQVQEQSLKVALDELFKEIDVTYKVVGNQIVLKNEPKKQSTNGQEDRIPYIKPIPVKRTIAISTAVHDSLTRTPITTETPKPVSGKSITKEVMLQNLRRMMAEIVNYANEVKETLIASTQEGYIPIVDSSRTEQRDSTYKIPPTTEMSSTGNEVSTEEKDSSGYIRRPFQVSFIPPLSTNGMESGQTVNEFSVNILAGYAAGLEGVEIGYLLNIERDYVRGIQLAGFANLVRNQVTGAQFAGFMNLNGGFTKAAQFAGFANIVGDSVHAGQFAGFANIVGGKVDGIQLAGFANINKEGETGPQVAGFINVNGGNSQGVQLAAFANINKGDVEGVQISGFINKASKVKGTQIGFINLADTVQGAQIGFLSLSRSYRRFEIWASESLYANLAFKTGSRRFYNIFALGGQSWNSYYRWAFGYGVGSELSISKRVALNIDALAYHVNENEIWTNNLNLLNQLRTMLGIRLGRHSYLLVGPTFNVMVSQYTSTGLDSNSYGSAIAPSWTVFNETNGRTNVKMWPGANIGIRF